MAIANEYHLEMSDVFGQENVCRICLQHELSAQIKNKNMLAPCQCRGSSKFIHEYCLLEWCRKNEKIEEEMDELGKRQLFYRCEICLHKIYLLKNTSTICRSRRKIYKKIKEDIWIFLSAVGLVLFLAVGCVIIGIKLIQSFDAPNIDSSFSFNQYFYIILQVLIVVLTLASFLRFSLFFSIEQKRQYHVARPYQQRKYQGQQTDVRIIGQPQLNLIRRQEEPSPTQSEYSSD